MKPGKQIVLLKRFADGDLDHPDMSYDRRLSIPRRPVPTLWTNT